MEAEEKRIAFPRYAHYNAPIKYAIEKGTNAKCIIPPEMTKHTLEMGTKYSPEYVCSPFKILLGSMIEALDAGANTLAMVYGPCKLGFFGELEEQILHDMGYEFDFINLMEYSTGNPLDYLKAIRRISPGINIVKFLLAVRDALKMAEYTDDVTAEYYRNCGFEETEGEYKRIFNQFNHSMETALSASDIEKGYRKARQDMAAVPLSKPENPLRVGIVGELYTAMDPFSNLEVEEHLARMGVEVHRWMTVTNEVIHNRKIKDLRGKIEDLSEYVMGPTSEANIWAARDYAERGFDGIIHIKGSSCTPEIDIMPVLQNISTDYKIPVLYLTYDTQTSDVGLMTRLEAFYDMIRMRKQV